MSSQVEQFQGTSMSPAYEPRIEMKDPVKASTKLCPKRRRHTPPSPRIEAFPTIAAVAAAARKAAPAATSFSNTALSSHSSQPVNLCYCCSHSSLSSLCSDHRPAAATAATHTAFSSRIVNRPTCRQSAVHGASAWPHAPCRLYGRTPSHSLAKGLAHHAWCHIVHPQLRSEWRRTFWTHHTLTLHALHHIMYSFVPHAQRPIMHVQLCILCTAFHIIWCTAFHITKAQGLQLARVIESKHHTITAQMMLLQRANQDNFSQAVDQPHILHLTVKFITTKNEQGFHKNFESKKGC